MSDLDKLADTIATSRTVNACPSCCHTECACDCVTCTVAALSPRPPCPCKVCARHRRWAIEFAQAQGRIK